MMGRVQSCQGMVTSTPPPISLPKNALERKEAPMEGFRLNLGVGGVPVLILCHSGVVGDSGTLKSDWVQIPTWTFTCCVILSECLNFSGSQFSSSG